VKLLTINVDIGDGPTSIDTTLWAWVQWERKYKTTASKASSDMGFEDLAYLAYESSRAMKIVVPAVFDDYIKKIVHLEVVSSEERPTQEAPDDDS